MHPSGYPMSVFKELYNNFLTKLTVGDVLGQAFCVVIQW